MKRAKPSKPAKPARHAPPARQPKPAQSKPAQSKPAAVQDAPPATGRDGAIDYASKMEDVQQVGGPPGNIYRVIELVGSSDDSIEDAIDAAVARAHRTLRNLRWFEVVKTTGQIENGVVRHFQVTLKVGFTMEQMR